MVLNFGHTLGHAIEKAFNYSGYSHGEAVASGMYHISKIGEYLGLTDNGVSGLIKTAVEKYHLPSEIILEDKTVYNSALSLDKKGSGDDINLILLSQIGKSFIYKMDKAEFEKILEE